MYLCRYCITFYHYPTCFFSGLPTIFIPFLFSFISPYLTNKSFSCVADISFRSLLPRENVPAITIMPNEVSQLTFAVCL